MKTKRILLAEDEEMHSFSICVALKRAGFAVDVVEDHGGVIDIGKNADALVIDARLPTVALEGLEGASQLVESGLDESVPLVFISVYGESEPNVQNKLKQLPNLEGRYIWLEKPFEMTSLVTILRNKLGHG